ncbi:MAG: YkgJ family cysteine cluster protein [Thermoprotei archaeon]|nr:YkgJ family cysteine cluster protein [Thermoprotei archaeon]
MICIKCAKCCFNTEMILTPSDVSRISKLGYDPSEFTVKRDGFIRLRNVDGACYFLDRKTLRCSIYPHRPIGCVLYPIVYDPATNMLTVDRECPMHWTVTMSDLVKARPIMARALWELRILRPNELPKLPN